MLASLLYGFKASGRIGMADKEVPASGKYIEAIKLDDLRKEGDYFLMAKTGEMGYSVYRYVEMPVTTYQFDKSLYSKEDCQVIEEVSKTISLWLNVNEEMFSSRLRMNIDEADRLAREAGSEVGCFDYDLWYEGQDHDVLPIHIEDINPISPDSAEVDLNFMTLMRDVPDESLVVHHKVIMHNNGWIWEIDDFTNGEGKWITSVCQDMILEYKNSMR